MKETITVLELISRIKKLRKEMDSLYNIYTDPESRAMVTLYNVSTQYTVNGKKIDDVKDEIIDIDSNIQNTFKKLQKLLIIKEQINATCKITIKSPFDGTDTELSIAQILVLKSPSISKYNIDYLTKLEEDYKYGSKVLADNQKTILANDKIDRYVNAKMNSLSINPTSDLAYDTYSKFAEEYRAANRLEILDPLNIHTTIQIRKSNMMDFYNSIDIKLMEFNASKKLWIDLDLNNDYWGLIN